MYEFSLTEEQQAVFDMAREFGAARIEPHAVAWDQAMEMPRDMLQAAAELGLAAIYVPESDGGSGLTRLDATLVFEALAMACPSVSSFLSIHNMVAWMVSSFGDDAMKTRYLPELITMQRIASYCLTEPGSGSDAAALRTRATRTNEGWSVNGTKSFISGGDYSDLYVVMCRTGDETPRGISALMVETGTPGLGFGAQEMKMGWRGQPTAQVILENCQVSADNLLGEEGAGFKYAMMGLDGGRLNIAAAALGGAQAALNKALAYTGERKAFGKTIDSFTITHACSSGRSAASMAASDDDESDNEDSNGTSDVIVMGGVGGGAAVVAIVAAAAVVAARRRQKPQQPQKVPACQNDVEVWKHDQIAVSNPSEMARSPAYCSV